MVDIEGWFIVVVVGRRGAGSQCGRSEVSTFGFRAWCTLCVVAVIGGEQSTIYVQHHLWVLPGSPLLPKLFLVLLFVVIVVGFQHRQIGCLRLASSSGYGRDDLPARSDCSSLFALHGYATAGDLPFGSVAALEVINVEMTHGALHLVDIESGVTVLRSEPLMIDVLEPGVGYRFAHLL